MLLLQSTMTVKMSQSDNKGKDTKMISCWHSFNLVQQLFLRCFNSVIQALIS